MIIRWPEASFFSLTVALYITESELVNASDKTEMWEDEENLIYSEQSRESSGSKDGIKTLVAVIIRH